VIWKRVGSRVIQALIRVVLHKRARQILLRLALEVEGSTEDLVVIVLDGFEALLDGLFGHEDMSDYPINDQWLVWCRRSCFSGLL